MFVKAIAPDSKTFTNHSSWIQKQVLIETEVCKETVWVNLEVTKLGKPSRASAVIFTNLWACSKLNESDSDRRSLIGKV
jgi:hypothetical protein